MDSSLSALLDNVESWRNEWGKCTQFANIIYWVLWIILAFEALDMLFMYAANSVFKEYMVLSTHVDF